LIPVGPIRVHLKLPAGIRGKNARLLVRGGKASLTSKQGTATLEVPSILDHEVIVFE
jgi:hypothetical protein